MPQTRLNDTIGSTKLAQIRSQLLTIVRWKETQQTMRYAAYVRTNCQDQTGNAHLTRQQETIKEWIAFQGGDLVGIYTDVAPGGRTTDRPALRLRR